jgi:dTDP-4-amino-4,6-dideoxygalactose transaminase
LQGAYAQLGYQKGDFPRAEALAAQVISLPLGPQLAGQDVDRVVAAIQVVRPHALERKGDETPA